MINTAAIKNNIKKMALPQIDNIIETGARQGMISLKQYAKRLVDAGIVDQETISWILNS
jgi:Tfp pilus assembly pilus retraction ATPase PilT